MLGSILFGCNSPPNLLISGDSIAHGLAIEKLGKCEVINIAKGGAGVSDAIQRVVDFKGDKTSVMIIAIGINDAKRKEYNQFFLMIGKLNILF